MCNRLADSYSKSKALNNRWLMFWLKISETFNTDENISIKSEWIHKSDKFKQWKMILK